MRLTFSILAAVALSAVVSAQANFECQTAASAFPALAGPADCEGIVSNNPSGKATVTTAALLTTASPAACTMFPSLGAQFARIRGNGPYSPTLTSGATIPRPIPTGTSAPTELRFPVPAGAIAVSFQWDAFVGDLADSTYNDGFDVSICNSTGARIIQLFRGDSFSAWVASGGCTIPDGGSGRELLPAGMKTFSGAFGAVPAGSYLSVAVWNSGDNTWNINFLLDNVVFSAPNILTGSGVASPSSVVAGGATVLTVALSATGAPNPPVGDSVVIDLSAFGGSPMQNIYDDGMTGGDLVAGDHTFTYTLLVPANQLSGGNTLNWGAADATRTTNGSISLGVLPGNDTCATATVITDGLVPGNNTLATDDTVTTCASSWSHQLWYTYSNPRSCSETVILSMCAADGGSASFDTVIGVYTGGCGALTLFACNDDFCSLQSKVTFTAAPFTTYVIGVGGWSANSGSFNMSVVSHDASSQQFGSGCGTVNVPTLNGTIPYLGQPGTLTVASADANATGLLFVSPPGGVAMPIPPTACNLYLQQGGMVLFLLFQTDALGGWSFTATIPNDPALDCFPIDAQGIIIGVNGFSATNGLHLILGH